MAAAIDFALVFREPCIPFMFDAPFTMSLLSWRGLPALALN